MLRDEHASPSTKVKNSTRAVTATTETGLFDGDRQMTSFHYLPNPSFIITASIQQVVTRVDVIVG